MEFLVLFATRGSWDHEIEALTFLLFSLSSRTSCGTTLLVHEELDGCSDQLGGDAMNR